jgi:hypothetical protein
MKKIKLLFLIALLPALVYSQGVEIVPFGGYMFGGSIKYYEGKLKIENGGNYGISLLVPVQTILDVEINYTHMDSKASFSPYAGYPGLEYLETTLGTNYIQVGAMKKLLPPDSKAQPFGSFSVGATWFTSPDMSDVWRFSITAGLGVKVMVSSRIGIIARGRLMMPMTFGSASFYFGSGGSGLSLNSWVAPFQGDFNGGLVFKLGG